LHGELIDIRLTVKFTAAACTALCCSSVSPGLCLLHDM
jgi:hypothetical protein